MSANLKRCFRISIVFSVLVLPIRGNAAGYWIGCSASYIEAQNRVDGEFDQMLKEIPRGERKIILRKAKELKAAAARDAWNLLEGTCGQGGCTVAEIRNLILSNIAAKTGNALSEESRAEGARYKIAAWMWIKSIVGVAIVNASLSFILTGGKIEFSEMGDEVRKNLQWVISTSVSTMLGGGILTYFISNKAEAMAYKAMEKGARSGGENKSIGVVDPLALQELTRLEANVNAHEARTLSGSRRATETLSAYFPAFDKAMEKALTSKNPYLAEAGYLNAAGVIWTIIKTRFETTPETKLVQETMATGLWSHLPETMRAGDLDQYYSKMVDAMFRVHAEAYNSQLSQEQFALEAEPFLRKLFYPTQLKDVIDQMRELRLAIPEQEVNRDAFNSATESNRLGRYLRPAGVR